jgi:hypothetical protein
MSDEIRIHQPCGKPMTATFFGHDNPTPRYRSQPIWACDRCHKWEPCDSWQGPFPDGWDGQRWT